MTTDSAGGDWARWLLGCGHEQTGRADAIPGRSVLYCPECVGDVPVKAPAGPLQWHYGPTDADPDRGKMWCGGCGGEVYALDGGWICSGCERQAGG